jgi:hypothetical protein
MTPALYAKGGEMTFEPGDRVRSLYSGKTGIVVSEPRRRDLAQGDAVSGVTVDVLLDEAPPGLVQLLYT